MPFDATRSLLEAVPNPIISEAWVSKLSSKGLKFTSRAFSIQVNEPLIMKDF
jgi:hypothetical protein